MHDRCLVEIYWLYYWLYVGLIETNVKSSNAFYFRPLKIKLSFDKAPVGVNTLNEILLQMCKAAGIKRKTSHCLRVTFASSLFNAGVEEKLIRDRTGHCSNALYKYEKASEEKVKEVSAVLGPSSEKEKCWKNCVPSEDVSAGPLNSCFFANCSVKVNYFE